MDSENGATGVPECRSPVRYDERPVPRISFPTTAPHDSAWLGNSAPHLFITPNHSIDHGTLRPRGLPGPHGMTPQRCVSTSVVSPWTSSAPSGQSHGAFARSRPEVDDFSPRSRRHDSALLPCAPLQPYPRPRRWNQSRSRAACAPRGPRLEHRCRERSYLWISRFFHS